MRLAFLKPDVFMLYDFIRMIFDVDKYFLLDIYMMFHKNISNRLQLIKIIAQLN